jgi:hypothetical protein
VAYRPKRGKFASPKTFNNVRGFIDEVLGGGGDFSGKITGELILSEGSGSAKEDL